MSDAPVSGQRSPHPDQIGPYRILQVLGEGGMGVVYEAEQTTPVHRRVALKVVRAEVESHDVIARFESERQALAVMGHEAIAKVLDAGTSEAGRPYFVMELVRGVPITDYCDGRSLSTRERIALFMLVCQGVQHAHQKGVIHRDLKPSNVLVTEDDGRPAPKIIDFGIAKATGQRLTDMTLVTAFGQAVGTPAYMSPEQAEMSGLDIDTRTDVYSLGVMLYELLVGRLPEDPTEVGLNAFMMRLAMRATDPPTPSARLATLERDRGVLAKLRRTDPDTLRRELRGDLDWIVMTAMDKDRSRRYATVNGLANDLGRFLADEPVQARPPTPTYRVRKFVRRHRVGVVASAAIVLALLAGAAATMGFVRATQANARAQQEAATAQQVSDFLVGLFDVSAPTRARGNVVTAREILDSGASRLETELASQPQVQARLMSTIGDVYRALGLYPEAERLLRHALATRERLGADAAERAATMTSLGRLRTAQGRYVEAESTLLGAVRLADAAAGPDPRATPSLAALGDLYREQGRYAESDSFVRLRLAGLERSVGREHGDYLEALGTLGSSQAEQGQPAAAESLFRRIVETRERTMGGQDPQLGGAYNNLASSLFEQGRTDEAEPLYRRALEIHTRTYGPAHSIVGIDLYNLANVESERKRFAEAIALYGRAQALWEKSVGPDHPYVAAALTSMANSYGLTERYADAVPLLRRALAIREKSLAPEHPFVGTTYHELGEMETKLGRFADAETHLRRALEIREKSLEPTSYYTAVTLDALAELYEETDRLDRAEAMYRRAVRQWEVSGRPEDDDERVETARSYAALLRRLGRGAEAVALERPVPAP